MNKKNLKLIMELIFIFILPIAFMLISVKSEVVNTYDGNGNLLTTEKIFDFSEDSILRDYNDNVTYINYLDFNQLSSFSYSIVTNSDVRLYENFNDYDLTNHKLLIYSNIQSWQLWNSDETFQGAWSIPNSDAVNLGNSNQIITCLYKYLKIRNYPLNNYLDDYGEINVYINVFDLTVMFGSGFEPSTLNEVLTYFDYTINFDYIESQIIELKSNNIISSNYVYNYTWYSKLFNELYDDLQINNNIVLKLITTYIILWVIMFLVWHLLYRFVDFMVHLFDKKE